ncbi:hypothetical protein [Moorena sp. SIO3H5]|uniref:hypothetical protein n=1 Tax=Moorena sp. SIO3H5 TaxID=2607834 RepID=UPI0013BA3001|nr:hypothetical protein [Moorena sp. SIO3H5]NEO74068.1 hypothetical protein [Moorena sp. SIO3H5]
MQRGSAVLGVPPMSDYRCGLGGFALLTCERAQEVSFIFVQVLSSFFPIPCSLFPVPCSLQK